MTQRTEIPPDRHAPDSLEWTMAESQNSRVNPTGADSEGAETKTIT